MSKLSKNWKELCVLRPASIRILAAACGIIFFGIGVLGLSDASAETRKTKIECPREKEKKETLKLSEDRIDLEIVGCLCRASKEELNFAIHSYTHISPWRPSTWVGDPDSSLSSKFEIAPGQTIRETFYCYTLEQVRALVGER